jgi:hypothetical protein
MVFFGVDADLFRSSLSPLVKLNDSYGCVVAMGSDF